MNIAKKNKKDGVTIHQEKLAFLSLHAFAHCDAVEKNCEQDVYLATLIEVIEEGKSSFVSNFDNEVSSGISYFSTVVYDLKQFEEKNV